MCRTALNVSKAAITAIYAIIWLIQFCTFDWRDSYCSESDKYPPTDGLFIVHSYVQELRERRYPTSKVHSCQGVSPTVMPYSTNESAYLYSYCSLSTSFVSSQLQVDALSYQLVLSLSLDRRLEVKKVPPRKSMAHSG